jgi:nicotinate-nucleotide--dimethylbenzimidazole phosphoribosyltransferase
VTDAVPDALAAALERIVAPAPAAEVPPADVTGVLADLWSWWASVGAGQPEARILAADAADPEEHCTVGAAAVLAGVTAADRAVDSGATLLVPRVTVRDEVASRAIITLLTRREASAVVHQGPAMTDREWMAMTAEVRDRAAATADLRGEPLALLSALGSSSFATVVGCLLGAAARRTPCIIDGTDELAAALIADRLCYRAKGWWLVASDSPDPGRGAAIDRIDATVGLPLRLSDEVGRGADAVTALLARLFDVTT